MLRRGLWSLTFLLLAASSSWGKGHASSVIFEEYPGDYRTPENHVIGIDHYVTEDTQEDQLIYSDYTTGVVRLLSITPDGEFAAGEEFKYSPPSALRIKFDLQDNADVAGLHLTLPDGTSSFAQRIPLKQSDVSIKNGEVMLAGTLMMPDTDGLHPGIVLLHGSAPLTRYSFGPYPHFFTSLGFAVLVYDKRGSGASTGTYFDDSTRYPESFASDALAAFRFLHGKAGVDPNRIGFWGSSEGGMVATQVAAQSKDVAFVINSSGFMMPVWQLNLYHVRAGMKDEGYPRRDIQEAVAYEKLMIRVGRTGRGWEQFQRRQEEVKSKKWFSTYSIYISSQKAILARWTHVLSFDPRPALQNIKCPVLGLFGQLDDEGPALVAVSNMRRGLEKGRNENYRLRIFEKANHALMLRMSNMAPGVFQNISTWLSRAIDLVPSVMTDSSSPQKGCCCCSS